MRMAVPADPAVHKPLPHWNMAKRSNAEECEALFFDNRPASKAAATL